MLVCNAPLVKLGIVQAAPYKLCLLTYSQKFASSMICLHILSILCTQNWRDLWDIFFEFSDQTGTVKKIKSWFGFINSDISPLNGIRKWIKMSGSLLNTVSVVSLAYTAVNICVSFLVAKWLGRRLSRVDQLVLLWLVWDVIIHVTVVSNSYFILFRKCLNI